MAKQVNYKGTIYASFGQLIKSLIDNGSELQVVCTNGKRVKAKIEYRVTTGLDCWLDITKFQAKQYLSESQVANIAIFEKALSLTRKLASGILRDQIDAKHEIARERKDNIKMDTAFLTIENGPFPTYL